MKRLAFNRKSSCSNVRAFGGQAVFAGTVPSGNSAPRARRTLALARILASAAILVGLKAFPQEKPQPQIIIDLKELGAAPDLFADQSDSKYQQRGVINVFWMDNERFAAAFSTTRRWSGTPKPEPLHVRLIIFDLQGKQLHRREWDFGADGPEATTTLVLAPGPDNSILAIHQSNSEGKIPDGDFMQVLNADTSLRQDFYIPATSNWVPSILPEPGLVLESYFTNHHSALTWFSGKPLNGGVKLDLPPGKEAVLAGPPGIAARVDCASSTLCFGVNVYTPQAAAPGRAAWSYSLPEPGMVPVPQVFLSSTALLVELHREDEKQAELVVIHPGGAATRLPPLPRGLQVTAVDGISKAAARFAISGSGEVGICGGLNIWCSEREQTLVIDVAANRIVFRQAISATGGRSSLSPDGRHLAIFDRDKLAVYALP
jgi:hypothetical protein